MAKILKNFVFGQKKNRPVPPQPDYQGERDRAEKFGEPHYANVGEFHNLQQAVHFQEKAENKLLVFQEYSEPADLKAEIAALRDEEYDPVYTIPVDQSSTPILVENYSTVGGDDDELYCLPYESPEVPPLPSPCLNTVGSRFSDDSTRNDLCDSDAYENIPNLSHGLRSHQSARTSVSDTGATGTPPNIHIPLNEEIADQCEGYDEPWEWGVQPKYSNINVQASPASSSVLSLGAEDHTYSEPPTSPQAVSSESLLSDSESCFGDDEMTTRQRRMYETAFDSRVKRDVDDFDRLMQSPVLQGDIFRPRIKPGETGPALRTASRSSFGSTSGSSTSSTPTHQPQLVSKPSPRPRHYPLHFTPTERRKVTLIRDHHLQRSSSPLSRPMKVLSNVESGFGNRNSHGAQDNRLISAFERQISLNHHWDSDSRCSDKSSSSQESMDQKEDFSVLPDRRDGSPKLFPLLKSASRDSIAYRGIQQNRNLNFNVQVSDLAPNIRSGVSSGSENRNSREFSSGKDEITSRTSSPFSVKKSIGDHTGVKVLPTDNSRPILTKANSTSSSQNTVHQTLNSQEDPIVSNSNNEDEPKLNNKAVRPLSLAANCREPELCNIQSPDNDDRPSDDYDPPWEFKTSVLRTSVNGSKSVPDCLSRHADDDSNSSSSSTTTTTDRVNNEPSNDRSSNESSQSPPSVVAKPNKPSGPPARPNLNLNLNLNSDSPRRARQNLTLNFGCSALNAVGEKVDADLTLEKQGWYHGSISRHDAENLLRVLKEGSYLVRNSESSKQDYSLSLRSARGFMHMKIVHSEGRFILGQFSNPFSSIPEMIHHYSLNKLPIKGAEHMSLLYPVIDQLL